MLGHFKKLVLGLVCVGFCVNSAWAETTVGPVKRGDSLWRIAVQHRPSKHTNLYQMIAAIQKLNPSAFHGNDLLPGSMLKVPTTHDEIVAALAGAAVSSTSNASQKSAASAPAVKASAVKTESATPSAESVVKTGAKAEVHSEKKASAPVSSPVIHSAASNTPAAPVMPTNLIAPNAPSANAGATVSNAKENAEIAPVLSVSQGAPAPAQKSNSDASDNVSLWSWVWFALLMGVLYYGWKHRYQLFPSLRGGNDIAARRLGLNRQPAEEHSYKTFPLWTRKKPEITEGQKAAPGEGEAIVTAMIAMAEGNYSEAKKALEVAIQKDPRNLDLRLKLLDTYIALNDREAYKQESDYILENMIDEADPNWGRIKSGYLRKWAYDL